MTPLVYERDLWHRYAEVISCVLLVAKTCLVLNPNVEKKLGRYRVLVRSVLTKVRVSLRGENSTDFGCPSTSVALLCSYAGVLQVDDRVVWRLLLPTIHDIKGCLNTQINKLGRRWVPYLLTVQVCCSSENDTDCLLGLCSKI